ncbi:hypothetical protein EBT31_11450 [bacterium]|nr:hypothetical protein [bacterium]
MTRTCETCIHYFESDFNAFCKRYPPVHDHTWPKVLKGHFCGEHQSSPKERQKSTRVPTTEAAKRIATLFGRKLTTEWSEREIRAFKNCGQIDLADLASAHQFPSRNHRIRHRAQFTTGPPRRGKAQRRKPQIPWIRPAPRLASAALWNS